MAQVNNIYVGKATVTKTGLKVDGKKMEMTEDFASRLEKLNLDGSTAIFMTNKEGQVCRVIFNGAIEVKGVETPKFGEEGGTYKCNYLVGIGYPCAMKAEKSPVLFSLRTYGKKAADAEPESTFYAMKAWDEIGDKAKVELSVPEGEKAPKMWVIARISQYNGKDQYTVTDYGIIPAAE